MTGGDLAGRVAVITGASRGIGAAVAKAYAASGAHVVLVARTVGGLEEVDDAIQAAGGTATLMPYDLAKPDDLGKLGAALAQKFGRLDILVGNAAMLGTLTPLTHMKAKEWERVMTVNVHANLALLRALDPLLRASDAGRAIFTTSGLARKPLAYWGAYCTSKAALEMMVTIYAAEMEITPVKVNMVDPGLVDTAILREAMPGGYHGPLTVRKPEDVVPVFLALASPSCTKHGEVLQASDYINLPQTRAKSR